VSYPVPYKHLGGPVYKIRRRDGNYLGKCFPKDERGIPWGWPYVKHYFKNGGPCRRCGKDRTAERSKS
jgi:hypothetical protein